MLLGDAHVEDAIREGVAENIHAGARRHGGGDAHDLVIMLRGLHQALAEDAGIGGRIGLGFHLRTADEVKGVDAVQLVGRRFGGSVALALLRHHMNEDRAFLRIAHILQHGQEVIKIMAIDRTDIIEAKLLEERAAREEPARQFFGAAGAFEDEGRHFLGEFLALLA